MLQCYNDTLRFSNFLLPSGRSGGGFERTGGGLGPKESDLDSYGGTIQAAWLVGCGGGYPPKLSKRIMSSSTPREWRRSRTVFAIIGGPQR